jgi:hypothetical protein
MGTRSPFSLSICSRNVSISFSVAWSVKLNARMKPRPAYYRSAFAYEAAGEISDRRTLMYRSFSAANCSVPAVSRTSICMERPSNVRDEMKMTTHHARLAVQGNSSFVRFCQTPMRYQHQIQDSIICKERTFDLIRIGFKNQLAAREPETVECTHSGIVL